MKIKKISSLLKKIYLHFFLELFCFVILFILSSISLTLFYKHNNPKITYLMVKRANEAKQLNSQYKTERQWIDFEDLGFFNINSVIRAEDPSFYSHHGVNMKNLFLAFREFRQRKANQIIRGYSTISQQTAKNVFLYSKKTIPRKILEVYFTFLIEAFWGKKRILEVYLNVIEWGEGIYGIRSSANHYFNKEPKDLSLDESILLSCILINPRKYKPDTTHHYILHRARCIKSHFEKKVARND